MNIVFDKTPSKEDVDQLGQHLLEYNQSKVCNYAYDDFLIKLEDEERNMVAGMHCIVGNGWLYFDSLWVKKSLRGEGYGKQLVDMAEKEAIKRDCVGIYFYTYSFQNPKFYEKLGYIKFASLNDFAGDHTKIYMAKYLV